MTRTTWNAARGIALAAALVLAATADHHGARAQTPGAAQPPAAAPTGILADPTFQAAQKRYDALPDAERRAIQEALMWTGDFAGAGSGVYGPLTFRAIQAFQKRAGATPDGFLAAKERAMLDAVAGKARADIRFARLQDGKAGLQIGVPQAVLSKVTPARMGTRYAAPDGSAALETFAQPGIDLPTLFAQLTADQPGRKITYKVLRPDFFVFAADQDGRRSYTRFAPGGAGLKGFVFSYPVAAAGVYDRVSVAIANSFEPAPGAPAGTATANAPAGSNASAGTSAPAGPAAPTGVQPGQPFATGLALAAGKVLTVAAVADCASPTAAGRPAKVERSDKASGLAVLDVPGLKGPAAATVLAARPADGASVLALGFAPGPGGAPALSVSPGEIRLPAGSDRLRVLAPLQTGGAGAPVFDRGGGLVGLVGATSQEPRLVAGIVPAASYPLIGPEALAAMGIAGLAPAAGTAASGSGMGDLAARGRDLVVAVTCR